MSDSSLLIIGAHGQLGKALLAQYPNAAAVDSQELDITNTEQLAQFDWSKITIIINAAAYTNVDGAESADGRKAAWLVNVVGIRNITEIALAHNLALVHISSDYVFDGEQSDHLESEPFSPLGVYGQTKAAGDSLVSLVPKHYIIRTSWVIGEGKNFVRTMLELGQKGIAPTVVADQIGRLTFTGELVRAIDHLLVHGCTYGTYNVTNSGQAVSWANITRSIFTAASYNLAVTDTTTAAYFKTKTGIAPRPLQSSLSLAKLQATGFVSTDWRDNLAKYISKETTT